MRLKTIPGVLCALFIFHPSQTNCAPADGEAADCYLDIIKLYQKGQSDEKEGKQLEALQEFHGVLQMVAELSKNFPGWNRLIVDFRRTRTIDAIRALEASIKAGGAAVPALAPVEAPNVARTGGKPTGTDNATADSRTANAAKPLAVFPTEWKLIQGPVTYANEYERDMAYLRYSVDNHREGLPKVNGVVDDRSLQYNLGRLRELSDKQDVIPEELRLRVRAAIDEAMRVLEGD